MYLSFLKKIRDMDLQLAKKQREDLGTTTRKSTFVDRCLQTRSTHSELWKKLDLELEEDDPEIKGMSVESLTAKATVIYKRTVDKAASSLKAKKDLETRKAAQRDRVLEQMVKKSPQDFLNEAIDQRIAAASKAMPKPSKAAFRAPPGLPIDAASAFVSASSNANMTKDDVAAFVSANPRGSDKGKGRGAGKSPSSRGRGRGRSTRGRGRSRSSFKGSFDKGLDKGFDKGSGKNYNTGSKGGKTSQQDSVFRFGRKGKGKGEETGKAGKGKSKGSGKSAGKPKGRPSYN